MDLSQIDTAAVMQGIIGRLLTQIEIQNLMVRKLNDRIKELEEKADEESE